MNANGWHYAQGEKTFGPVDLKELQVILSRISDPRNLLVWRAGFEGWQRAGNVPELAQPIDKPPPLPQTSQPRKSANSQQQTDPKLTGIGGWLILVALGQIFGPIRLLVSIAQYYSTLDSNIIGKLPVTFAGEAVINFFVLVLSIYTAVLFFRKSKRFPRFFVYEILAAIFLVPLDAMWIAVAASMETGQSAEQLFQIEPSEIGQTIAAAIIGSVWILYIFKSKRVANTFTV
jgi:Protein of unknown function (DUF2569)/GYF domain 2